MTSKVPTSDTAGEHAAPFVSIIVPCRNEEPFIAACLDSILASDFPKNRMEVLVVDGASEDGTRQIVERYAEAHSFIRLLTNEKRIIPAAMNLGIRSARGEIIMKMDAHTVYATDYISQCVHYLNAYGADNVGGVIRTLPRHNTLIGRAIALALSHRFGVGNSYFRIGVGEPRWADTAFSGCYRKAVFEQVGLYDERIEFSEDIVLNNKLVKAGGKILLVPQIVSDYLARSDMKSFWLHSWRNGKWSILPFRYMAAFPVSWRHLAPLGLVLGLLGLAGLALAGHLSFVFFGLLAGAYLAGSLNASVELALREREMRYLPVLPLVFGALHFGYGFGECHGVIRLVFSRLERGLPEGNDRLRNILWLSFAATCPLVAVEFLRFNSETLRIHVAIPMLILAFILALGVASIVRRGDRGDETARNSLRRNELQWLLSIAMLCLVGWHFVGWLRAEDWVLPTRELVKVGIGATTVWGILTFFPLERSFLEQFWRMVIASSAILTTLLILEYAFFFNYPFLGNQFGGIPNAYSIQLAWYLTPITLFAITRVHGAKNRSLAWLVLWIFVTALLYITSRSAWIAVLAGNILMAFRVGFRRFMPTAGVVLGAVIAGVLFLHISVQSQISLPRRALWIISPNSVPELHTYENRFDLLRRSWDCFKKAPLIGIGLQQTERCIQFETHNDYMKILSNLGLVGLVLFVTVLAIVGTHVWIPVRSRSEDLGWTALGGLASFVAILIVMMFVNVYSTTFFWVLLGLLVAGANVSRDPSPECVQLVPQEDRPEAVGVPGGLPARDLPLVSFIMSVYAQDSVAELKRALESAVGQDYPSLEVALAVDGPVPHEIHRAIEEVQVGTAVPIRLVWLPVNQRLGRALNRAIEVAGGDFLARADADDYSMPERIRAQVEYLLAHPDIDVVGCRVEEVFEDGTVNHTRMPTTHEACVAAFIRHDPIHHPTAVFRRRFFEKAGLYSGDKCDDTDLWFAGIKAGCRFGNLDRVLYRMFLDQKFFSRRKDPRWIWWVLAHRMRIVRELEYGIRGYFWAVLRAGIMLLLPRPLLESAYRMRNLVWTRV